MTKDKNTSLTIKQKIQIIDYFLFNKDESYTSIATKFSIIFRKEISAKTVSNYIKSEERLRDMANMNPKRIRSVSKSKFEKINNALYEKLLFIESCGATYTEKMIKDIGLQIAKELNDASFTASNGWLQSFKQKYGINSKVLSGESADIVNLDLSSYYEVIEEKLKVYRPRDIYNCDETAHFFKQGSSKSLMIKTRKGIKKCKERVTALFCVNLDGSEKRKPLLIGKSAKPRALKHFNYSNICDYKSNKTAWMTSKIFGEWIKIFDKECIMTRRKILLLLDNCPAHNLKFTPQNIELCYLPKNSTAITQPLDKGIIKSFKTYYYYFLNTDVISKLNVDEKAEKIFKKYTLRDAMIFTSWAWDEITAQTIVNCWRNAGYGVKDNENLVGLEQEDTFLQNMPDIIQQLGFDDPVHITELIGDFITENEMIMDLYNTKEFKEDMEDHNLTENTHAGNEPDLFKIQNMEKYCEDGATNLDDVLKNEHGGENIYESKMDLENSELPYESNSEATSKSTEETLPLEKVFEAYNIFKNYIINLKDLKPCYLNGLKKYETLLYEKKVVKRKITDYLVLKKE